MKKLLICLLLICATVCSAESTSAYRPAYSGVSSGLTRLFSNKSDDTTTYPYTAIGLIEATFKCGCSGVATVFMVGSHAAMTAAHCLMCATHNELLDYATFSFGIRSNGSPLVRYTDSITFWYGTTFPDGYYFDAQETDYAYIRFNRDIGSTTGWFGLTVLDDTGVEGKHFNAAGYVDTDFSTDRGTATVYDYNLLRLSFSPIPGNSGSPLFTDDYHVIGIITSRDNSNGYSYRIQDFLIDELLEEGLVELG